MKEGGFNLCKFTSSSQSLQKNIDMLDKGISIDDKEEEKTYAQSTLENSGGL